jgi:NADH-quinone oxidoreductase subunit M
MFPYLTVIIFLPLVGALAVALQSKDNRTGIRLMAALFSGIAFVVSVVMFFQFDRADSGLQFKEYIPWIPSLGISYFMAVDGLSLPLVVLTTMIGFLAVIGSWHIKLRPKEYFALLLILETGIIGVFTSLDLLVFFLFWEVELIPMYLLIAIWGSARREYAAMKFVLYTIVGSAVMLVGIFATYFASAERTFDMTILAQNHFPLATQLILFPLLFFAFAVKLPMWPFHTWLPDAHTEAPTAVSVILAGVLLKMGGYGMFRVAAGLMPDALAYYAPWLGLIAVLNILIGAGCCFVQKDLKRLIAYSSVSHMGFVLLGLAAMTPLGLTGAALQMFTHGTITGLLFFLVGTVYEKTHTRQIADMRGIAARMPRLASLFVVGSLASLGLPGMSGFVAEFVTFLGSYQGLYEQAGIFTIISAIGVVLTAGYLLWTVQRVFFGPLIPSMAHVGDARGMELVPLWSLVAITVFVGLYPAIVSDLFSLGVTPLLDKLPQVTAALAH